MKVRLFKGEFLNSWGIAERCTAAGTGALNIFSAVLMDAGSDEPILRSSDIKRSVIVKTQGLEVIEPGSAVLPVKRVSDLFSKIRGDEMTLEVKEGTATLTAGKSRYRFSTYPAEDFPALPSAANGTPLFTIQSGELVRALEYGSLCADLKQSYPEYLSAVYFDKQTILNTVSTDKRRVAIYQAEVDAGDAEDSPLLQVAGIRDLQKFFGMSKTDFTVTISSDDSQVYFVGDKIEFSIRKTISKFPAYTKQMSRAFPVRAMIDRGELMAALECIGIVVREYSNMVKIAFNGNECSLSGQAAEFGDAHEIVKCEYAGDPLTAYFNVRFMQEGIKACEGPNVTLAFDEDCHMMRIESSSSGKFIYILAPVDAGDGDSGNEQEVPQEA